MGERQHAGDRTHVRARWRHQLKVDIDDDFPLYQEVHLEHQAVDGGVHGSLDRVLYGHEGEVGPPRPHGVEHLGQTRYREHGSRGVVGLGEQRLLREGARRSEKGDGDGVRPSTPTALWGRRPGHVRAG